MLKSKTNIINQRPAKRELRKAKNNLVRAQIRYGNFCLWIASRPIHRLVLQHAPDDVHELSPQVHQRLGFCFSLRYLLPEIRPRFVVACRRYLREGHEVEGAVQTAVAGPRLAIPLLLARTVFARRASRVLRKRSRRAKTVDVA